MYLTVYKYLQDACPHAEYLCAMALERTAPGLNASNIKQVFENLFLNPLISCGWCTELDESVLEFDMSFSSMCKVSQGQVSSKVRQNRGENV